VEDYCIRWITGVSITIPDLASQGQYLIKSLISKVATHFGLSDTVPTFLAATAMLQWRDSPNPIMELHKLQKQLSQLAHSKTYSQGPTRRSAVVPIHRASLGLDEVCTRFLQGRCKFAADMCDRRHVTPRSREHHQPESPRSIPSNRSRAECRAFKDGRCSYGERCRYRHSVELGSRRPADTSDPAAKRPRVDDSQPLN